MPRLIAIDLGSHQVKVSTWRVSGRNAPVLEDRFSGAVPQDGTPPGLVARFAALDAMIDEQPTLTAGPSDRCVLALPGELATYHRTVLPFSDKAQVEKTLPFALEAEVPFDLDDMLLGWRVLEAGDASEVLSVVSRGEQVQEWIAGLAERGLDPELVHVDTELLGMVAGGPGIGGGAQAVVDVGHTHTAVAIVVDGQVHDCRTVSVAGQAFTRAIQGALGCSWQEAEARKHGTWTDASDAEDTDPGKPQSGYARLPDPARQAMDGAIGLLLAELRSTLIRAEDTLDVDIEEIRLTGGGAGFTELWDYVAADLGVPVRPAAPSDGEVVPSTWTLTHAAMLGLRSGGSEAVDLRIGELAYRGGTDMLRMGLTYGGLGAMVFAATVLVIFVMNYRALAVQQATTEEAIAAIVTETFPEIPEGQRTGGSSAIAAIQALTDDAELRADMLGSGAGGVPPMLDMLAQLTQAFPPHPSVTVTVRDLTITPTTITFEGETDSFASSAAVEGALQSGGFPTALKGDDQQGRDYIRFPVSIALDETLVEGAELASGEEG